MSGKLSVKNLSQSQGGMWPAKILFEEVSFQWESPSLHVIMGNSGGGKSSFLKTIGGVWRPQKGSIHINEIPIWRETSMVQNQDAVSKIGFAFQNNALFSSLKNIENLLYPHSKRFPKMPNKERTELAMHWLEKVGLENSAYILPHEISGGMQKRLAIARTLILDPEIIFLDDPTAGLDPITSESIGNMLGDLLKGKDSLVIIVTNDPGRAAVWGRNVHFLHDNKFYQPQDEGYAEARGNYLD